MLILPNEIKLHLVVHANRTKGRGVFARGIADTREKYRFFSSNEATYEQQLQLEVYLNKSFGTILFHLLEAICLLHKPEKQAERRITIPASFKQH